MPADSVSSLTSNAALNAVMSNNMRISGSYIFSLDGLVLACSETYDRSSNPRNSDTDIHHITEFLFGTLMTNTFLNP
ncbi:unnamed protein product, partial [Rotaria magnacalcarata]